MSLSIPRSRILGTGSAVPERVLSNEDLEKIVDTSDEWITRRSGIKERRIATPGGSEGTTDLATAAARRALEMAGIQAAELNMIVCGTVTPDRQFPSTACMVQEALGAENASAYDLSAGCSGFLYSLAQADNALRSGWAGTALVIGVERLSTILNWQDRGTCVLLGDGAGAVVIRAGEGEDGILSTHLKSDGGYGNLLYSEWGNEFRPEILKDIEQKPFYVVMDGNRIFKRAIQRLAAITREAIEHNAMTSDDVDILIPHQANLRIIEGLASALDMSMDKVFTNIHKYGNTSTASVPLALDEANRSGRIAKGDIVLLEAFGAGLTWGAAMVRWS